jgi:hypothetical protein
MDTFVTAKFTSTKNTHTPYPVTPHLTNITGIESVFKTVLGTKENRQNHILFDGYIVTRFYGGEIATIDENVP